MGTKSTIIQKLDDGSYRSVYCHWDGYLSNNGRILLNDYKDKEKVSKLLDLGALSLLKSEVEIPDGVIHNNDNRHDRITVAYLRDCGAEGWQGVRYSNSKSLKKSITSDYSYLFFDGDWYIPKDLIMRGYSSEHKSEDNFVHLITNIINIEGVDLVMLSDFESVLK